MVTRQAAVLLGTFVPLLVACSGPSSLPPPPGAAESGAREQAITDWRVVTVTDSMTDRVSKAAITTNSEGHQLRIARLDEGIWANFRLSENSVGVLGERSPMIRVDKLEPEDLDVFRRNVIGGPFEHLVQAESRSISWLLERGTSSDFGTLREMMDGQTVVFRFFPFASDFKETEFSLRGAKSAISEATGIPPERDEAAAAAFAAKMKEGEGFTEALSSTLFSCGTTPGAKFDRCFARHSECLRKSDLSAEKFLACFNAPGK